jgi:hypothetical protein
MWTDTFLYLPYMALGWRFITTGWWKVGGESYPSFPSKFGGSWSVTLLWISLWEFVFASVGRPVGEVCNLDFPWSYADAWVCKELKLVWFGDFKIQFWVLCSGILGACLASVFPILRWADVRTGRGLSASRILVCFLFVDLCWVTLYVFVY